MELHDIETGELPRISDLALNAGHRERAERAERKRELVVGSTINAKIDAALSKIKPVLKTNKLEKDKAGQRGDYTSYDRILSIIVPLLREQGIIIRHNAGRIITIDKTFWLPVTCYLIDKVTGESVECEIPFPIVQVNPHGVASALMYGKRISTVTVLGLATGADGEDDNGEAAMPRSMDVDSEEEELAREFEATATEPEANKLRKAYEKRLADLEPDAYERVKTRFVAHVKKLRLAPVTDDPAPKAKGAAKNRIAATHDGGAA
jgi:hypothetical protein